MRIFDGRGGNYAFAMSNVALSSEGVEQTFENGKWVLTQRDGVSMWTARSATHEGAVLLLIAARLGLSIVDGDLTDTPDPEDGS